NVDDRLAEIAHHFFKAGDPQDLGKAVDYASRAASNASERLAFEAAVTHYEQALHAQTLSGAVNQGRRCELLLALGYAHSAAGDVPRARRTMLEALPFARGSGDAHGLALVAIGLCKIGMGWNKPGEVDAEAASLLDEALAGLGSEDSVVRARLLTYRAQL